MSLEPEILIVPECGETAMRQMELGAPTPTCTEWVGRIPNKGLGVFSFGDYTVSRAAFYNPDHRFILPLEVQGPVSFLLLAGWTLPDEGGSYVRPLVNAWKEYAEHIDGRDVVVAGDFNASVIFPGKPNYHFSVFLDLLEASGVRSLYHEVSGDAHGEEKSPTFFMYRKPERPFHIDYVFAGERLRTRLKTFNVGSHADWSIHSDHVPLSAHFEPA